jgi:2,3-diketo-5-methylthio-1-phosphopentane phosphatase
MSLKILCDFDGTITRADTADAVFSALAAPEWHAIEELWDAGEIGSAECMRRQMELVDASVSGLNEVLDSLEIDPTFPEFAQFCAANGFELVIVSDGVDYFIRRILSRYGLAGLPIRANQLIRTGERSFTLAHPFSVKDCAAGAGNCKCACEAATPTSRQTVLIGDGRSDFCVSEEADIVFAKKSLLRYTREKGIPALPFETFAEIAAALAPAMPAETATPLADAA